VDCSLHLGTMTKSPSTSASTPRALFLGRAFLLGAGWALVVGCTYLTEDGAIIRPGGEALALELPEGCTADRTSSGYAIFCPKGTKTSAATPPERGQDDPAPTEPAQSACE